MEKEEDIYYQELKILKFFISKQPDDKVKKSRIKEPYKKYFIKSYRSLNKLLKPIKRFLKNSSE
jgi:hypothetical protein